MGPGSREFECRLLRYVPNVLTGEFVNIGLSMWTPGRQGSAFADMRLRRNWDRVAQFDPDADIELLDATAREITQLLRDAPDPAEIMGKLEQSLSNAVQLSDAWRVQCEDASREMDTLAALYLDTAEPRVQRVVRDTLETISSYRERISLSLPLWGTVAAGQPIEAVQIPETISIDDIVGSKNVFALRVRGDSMQDEHIVSGDFVLVEKTRKALNGDIVVALIDGYETTLKRFYLQGDAVRLQPSNAMLSPIIVPAASVEIQGKVIGVLRKY